jgi:hypothetical protein
VTHTASSLQIVIRRCFTFLFQALFFLLLSDNFFFELTLSTNMVARLKSKLSSLHTAMKAVLITLEHVRVWHHLVHHTIKHAYRHHHHIYHTISMTRLRRSDFKSLSKRRRLCMSDRCCKSQQVQSCWAQHHMEMKKEADAARQCPEMSMSTWSVDSYSTEIEAAMYYIYSLSFVWSSRP